MLPTPHPANGAPVPAALRLLCWCCSAAPCLPPSLSPSPRPPRRAPPSWPQQRGRHRQQHRQQQGRHQQREHHHLRQRSTGWATVTWSVLQTQSKQQPRQPLGLCRARPSTDGPVQALAGCAHLTQQLGCVTAQHNLSMQVAGCNTLAQVDAWPSLPYAAAGAAAGAVAAAAAAVTRPPQLSGPPMQPGRPTCTDVADQVLNLLVAEELGEQAGPVGLHSDACCLDNSVDVVGLCVEGRTAWGEQQPGGPGVRRGAWAVPHNSQ